MVLRTKRVTLTFQHPFALKGVDRRLAAGDYEVVTDEELIEEVSFPVYRRVATLIFLPADAANHLRSKWSMSILSISLRPISGIRPRDCGGTKPPSHLVGPLTFQANTLAETVRSLSGATRSYFSTVLLIW